MIKLQEATGAMEIDRVTVTKVMDGEKETGGNGVDTHIATKRHHRIVEIGHAQLATIIQFVQQTLLENLSQKASIRSTKAILLVVSSRTVRR
jgi:hypothetical protein